MIENRLKLSGMRFGNLLVIEESGKKNRSITWRCKCDCGNEVIAIGGNLKAGVKKSCGCLLIKGAADRVRTHGMSSTPIYKLWCSMVKRCSNQNDKDYSNYGGRGIKVSTNWLSFENFYKDMGDRPQGLTLDRIDTNSSYCKDNCRWATPKEQNGNKTTSRNITYNNITQTIGEWCRELNIPSTTFRRKFLDKGLTIDQIIKECS